MAKQEKRETSPFAELSFQAQQDKWREWRSRQWNFREAKEEEKERQPAQEAPLPPPARPAPTRHRELDRVLNRHQTAAKKAGAFCSITQNDPAGK